MKEAITEFLESDGFKLFYTIEGEGMPAIVIGSHQYYPKVFSKNLKEHFQFFFMDHRGFTPDKDPCDETSFTLLNILTDIHKIQLKLGLKEVVLIGHSVHALMAIEYAKKYPDCVSKLILIASSHEGDGNIDIYNAQREYFEFASPERKAACKYRNDTIEAKIKSELEAASEISEATKKFLQPGPKMFNDLFGPLIWYDFNFDPQHLYENLTLNIGFELIWLKMFYKYNVLESLDRIKCPIFLALGRHDYRNPPQLWEPLRPHFNNLTIQIFEKSGHMPQLKEAELFDQELLAWMKKTSV